MKTVFRPISRFFGVHSVQFAESPFRKYPQYSIPGGLWTVYTMLFCFFVVFLYFLLDWDKPTKSRYISGQVLNEQNIPVGNADVKFSKGGGDLTDENGNFFLRYNADITKGRLEIEHKLYESPIFHNIEALVADTARFRIILRDSDKRRERPMANAEPQTLTSSDPADTPIQTLDSGIASGSGRADPNRIRYALTWKKLLDWKEKYRAEGMELVDLETYYHQGTRFYAGVWAPGQPQHELWRSQNWKQFTGKRDERNKAGLAMVDIEIHSSKGQTYYHGLYAPAGISPHRLWGEVDWKTIVAKDQQFRGEGYRMIAIEAYIRGGRQNFAAIWESANDEERLWKESTRDRLWSQNNKYIDEGLGLVDLEIYTRGNKREYIGLWRANSGATEAYTLTPWAQFDVVRDDFAGKNFRLVDFELTSDKGELKASGIWQAGGVAF